MAITIKEDDDSPTFDMSGGTGTLSRRFTLRGTDNEADVYTTVLAEVEAIYQGFIRTGISTSRKYAGGMHKVAVQYGDPHSSSGGAGSGGTPFGETPAIPTSIPSGGTPLNPVSDGMEFTFDVSTESKHITQSKAVLYAVGLNGATPAETHGAIGATADGSVNGCDVLVPKRDFTITVQREELTLDYYRTVSRIAGTINDDSWGGFDADSVLYLGCNAQGTQRGLWTVNHRFAENPNLEDVELVSYEAWAALTDYAVGNLATNDSGKLYRVKVAGTSAGSGGPTGTGAGITDGSVTWDYVSATVGLTVPFVGGWHYLDVAFAPDSSTGRSRPIAAYVHRVYDRSDFSDLEVGI